MEELIDLTWFMGGEGGGGVGGKGRGGGRREKWPKALYAHMNNKTIKKNKAIKKKLEVLINYSGLKSDIEKVTSNIFFGNMVI
jgi:hypothetical protein